MPTIFAQSHSPEDIRKHAGQTYDEIRGGWVKQPPGITAGFENILLSIFMQTMLAAYEIAAQLAEMNERARTADDPTMDKEFSDIATKVKKWRGTSE